MTIQRCGLQALVAYKNCGFTGKYKRKPLEFTLKLNAPSPIYGVLPVELYTVHELSLFVDVCTTQMLMEEEARRHHYMLSTECVSEHIT